jgi:hypothetical protein
LDEGRTVFVKFFGKQEVPKWLRRGARLFLYESGGNREIVGEAKITEITSGTMDEVWATFGEKIFLTRAELEQYVGDRKERRMLVIVLSEAKRFGTPLNLRRALTMAGQYMTRELLTSLMDS